MVSDAYAATCKAPLICTGTNKALQWTGSDFDCITIPIITYRNANANLSADASVAYCNADEIVIGGGGTCDTFSNSTYLTGFATLITSVPVHVGDVNVPFGLTPTADGWLADCDGSGSTNYPNAGGAAHAYAICMKKP